ncbi:hypothetical protein J0910_31095 [Nocardiopsis sp. CNT-189]|uniref:hypothetical protein n=1 Tax=Nocardiopsis oceanisediminis TaxID=2816862 RepID=UPI003B2B0CEA
MSQTFCVYVPQKSLENFDIGRAQQTWGWLPEALQNKVGGVPADQMAASMQPGDTILLGHHANVGPRVPHGHMADAVFVRVVTGRIEGALHEDASQLWPNAVYDKRVKFELVSETDDVPVASLGGPQVAEAFRLSGIHRGVPVMVDESKQELAAAFALLDSDPQEQDEADQPDPASSGHIAHTGAVDTVILAKARAEHRKLKQQKFGKAPTIECSLCGRTLPRRLVRAAHIKARKHCTDMEFFDVANLMPACALGCDELFEHGHIYVDGEGVIRPGSNTTATKDLQKAVSLLEGKECAAFSDDSSAYFAFHRQKTAHPV